MSVRRKLCKTALSRPTFGAFGFPYTSPSEKREQERTADVIACAAPLLTTDHLGIGEKQSTIKWGGGWGCAQVQLKHLREPYQLPQPGNGASNNDRRAHESIPSY
ncbi:hypothetical protein DPX16_14007 [Anabarilius grahami]|uniref:Uncharacterized protein n=1 Tax=Anabarilius grahami TaxID=495550 RepID=A0A3N0Y9V7_ANAGA|nr:hypothetical protein DPX16_14007 [Anabarilius grahami]